MSRALGWRLSSSNCHGLEGGPSDITNPFHRDMISSTDRLHVETWSTILDLFIYIPHLMETGCTKKSFVEFFGLIVDIYSTREA